MDVSFFNKSATGNKKKISPTLRPFEMTGLKVDCRKTIRTRDKTAIRITDIEVKLLIDMSLSREWDVTFGKHGELFPNTLINLPVDEKIVI